MQFGVMTQHFRHHASPAAIRDVAQAAEALGYDSVWVMDHVVIPDVPEVHDRGFTATVYDPLMTLAYLAACTVRVRLGTTVLIVPYRSPLVQASMLATLDQLCDGRLNLGIGVGWLPQEFAALGVPFHHRGVLTDEYLAAMQVLWSQDRARFAGRTVRFENVMLEPKPVQRPHPPLWVGGSTPPALRRAARIGAVWHPTTQPPAAIARRAAELRAYAAAAGRDPAQIGIHMRAMLKLLPAGDRDTSRVSLIGTPQEIIAAVRAYRTAGLDGFVLDTFWGHPATEHATTADVLAALEAFAREVLPAVRG